jgi:FixJ family two-component response regulator
MAAFVHIVDDDDAMRRALRRLFEASGFTVLTYASGAKLLASPQLDDPGCIILDLQMPGLNGLELQKKLAERAPPLPVVFLTGQGNIASSVQAMKAGADDFLEKSAPGADLLTAVSQALQKHQLLRAEYDRDAALNAKVADLTKRETQVFTLMARGKRNKQIAYEIGTSERTVKAHRRNIMEKLNVRSFAEAVTVADRLGLTDPSNEKP